METQEIVRISFKTRLSSIYSSNRKVQRIETILDIYPNICSFYNEYVIETIRRLVLDNVITDYVNDENDEDDEIILNYLKGSWQHINNREFGNHVLEEIGLTAHELRNSMKLLTVNLIEDTLFDANEHVMGEASDDGKRVVDILEMSAVDETYGEYGLPVSMTIEATVALDHFKRIGL